MKVPVLLLIITLSLLTSVEYAEAKVQGKPNTLLIFLDNVGWSGGSVCAAEVIMTRRK